MVPLRAGSGEAANAGVMGSAAVAVTNPIVVAKCDKKSARECCCRGSVAQSDVVVVRCVLEADGDDDDKKASLDVNSANSATNRTFIVFQARELSISDKKGKTKRYSEVQRLLLAQLFAAVAAADYEYWILSSSWSMDDKRHGGVSELARWLKLTFCELNRILLLFSSGTELVP